MLVSRHPSSMVAPLRVLVTLAALAPFLAPFLAPAEAEATVMVEVPVADMAFVADAIVIGRVSHVGTRLELSGPEPMPYTVSTLTVERWLVGADGRSEVSIEEVGGQWQGQEVRVAGTPEYRAGERVLVFLRKDEQGRYRTYGMAQGKFSLQAAVDGPTVAHRDLGEVAFAHWAGGEMQVDHGHAGAMPLAELVGRIEQVVEVRP